MERLDEFLETFEKVHLARRREPIPAVELFPDDYVSRHTSFQTMQEMLAAGKIREAEDLFTPEWSAFVAAHSQFTSWDEMLDDATLAWINRNLTP